ncbi:hypothetical protein [Amycolatopsis alba]|uniref:hypothetical protein n=1 Tax=Amycolatopsis alba TaxID=76020 RepID=UPI0003A4D4E2|nr:hypothetical protein [Amycolatopsis alba]
MARTRCWTGRSPTPGHTATHVGTVGLFAAAGFELIEETKARSDRRPRWLMRLDL